MSPSEAPHAEALDRSKSTPPPDSAETRGRRRDARGTRKRLLETGRRAFARRGLAGTNLIQDILEPAGVAVGSFYHQFDNKTELLLAILEEDSHDLQAALQHAQEPTPGRCLLDIARDSYTATFDVVEHHADTLRILLRESAVDDPRVQHFAHKEHRRWIEILTHNFQRIAPADRSVAQIALAAELISVLTTGALAHYLALPQQERAAARERLIDGLVRLTLGGLPALDVDEATLGEVTLPVKSNTRSDSPRPERTGTDLKIESRRGDPLARPEAATGDA